MNIAYEINDNDEWQGLKNKKLVISPYALWYDLKLWNLTILMLSQIDILFSWLLVALLA